MIDDPVATRESICAVELGIVGYLGAASLRGLEAGGGGAAR